MSGVLGSGTRRRDLEGHQGIQGAVTSREAQGRNWTVTPTLLTALTLRIRRWWSFRTRGSGCRC
jgi:hypothetical protein